MVSPWSKTPYRVAGVVATARLSSPASAGGPQIFWPVQEEPPGAITFVAKVRGDAEASLAARRDAIRSLDPQVPVYDVKTLDQRLAEALARPRFFTTATLFLAALAVLLAVAGVYGAASYAVAQRTREMGVRMALGASAASIRGMVLRQGLFPVAIGLAAGVAGAVASGKSLEHLISGAEPPGIFTCAAACAVLLATVVIACWSATARVSAIDPVDALRAE